MQKIGKKDFLKITKRFLNFWATEALRLYIL